MPQSAIDSPWDQTALASPERHLSPSKRIHLLLEGVSITEER
jgi:hypothetical protein